MGKKLLKSESIAKMEELGLNCPDYFITGDKREISHYLSKHLDDKLSMRTERGEEFLCPFYFMIPGKDLLDVAYKHIDEGYKLLVAPSIPTQGCELFGAIMLSDSYSPDKDILEIVIGEGKVRELDSHPDKQVITVDNTKYNAVTQKEFPGGKAYMINQIFKEVKDKCYDITPCIIEFSYYNHPVGRLEDNKIYWEIRNSA